MILESRNYGAAPRSSFHMLSDSWKKFRQDANDLKRQDEPGIYGMDYWINTCEIQTDLEIGENCQKKGTLKEEEFIRKFKEKYKLRDNCGIVFTDGSKQTGRISTGVGIVVHGEEIGYSMSIDLHCPVFTAELMVIEKALVYALDNYWTKDLLILTDSQAVVKDVKDNRLNYIKQKITCVIRKRICKYIEEAAKHSENRDVG